MTLIYIIGSILLAGLIHELGHYLVALFYGHRLKFRRQGLRFIWDMPATHQREIAFAGFGLEFLSILIIGWFIPLYPVTVILHLMAYRFYAGEDSDFKWIL